MSLVILKKTAKTRLWQQLENKMKLDETKIMAGWSKHLMNILHFILKNSKTLINKSLSGKNQIINSSKEKSVITLA